MASETYDVTTPGDLFSLHGRVAVVTGASSGLGERFARVLHAAGAAVVVAARRADRLENLVAGHDRMLAVRCDVTDPVDRIELIDAARRFADEQDRVFAVLVNNAGMNRVAPALEESVGSFEEVLAVNLTSVFALSQLAAQHFIGAGTGGSIVNVASMLGLVASAPINEASYVASKSGVIGLTRELGCQWARKGVRVNALAPGWFETEMTAGSMFGDERSEAFLTRNCPIGRGGHADELDGALLLLASDAGGYLVGQTIAVDGGWTAR